MRVLNMPIKNILKFSSFLVLLAFVGRFQAQSVKVFEEKEGLLKVKAEDFYKRNYYIRLDFRLQDLGIKLSLKK